MPYNPQADGPRTQKNANSHVYKPAYKYEQIRQVQVPFGGGYRTTAAGRFDIRVMPRGYRA